MNGFMLHDASLSLKKEDNKKQFAYSRAIEEAGKILINIYTSTQIEDKIIRKLSILGGIVD